MKKINFQDLPTAISADCPSKKNLFYSVEEQDKMKSQALSIQSKLKQEFKVWLHSKYSPTDVVLIMSNLEKLVLQKVKQEQKKVANLKIRQAKKYFLEQLIVQEIDKYVLGQKSSLLPVISPPQDVQNKVHFRSISNENTYIPFTDHDTYSTLKQKYAQLKGIPKASIKFLINGKIPKDDQIYKTPEGPHKFIVVLVSKK